MWNVDAELYIILHINKEFRTQIRKHFASACADLALMKVRIHMFELTFVARIINLHKV